jgi:PEP-CTERM motif
MKKLFLYSLILLTSFAFTFGIIGNAQAVSICNVSDLGGPFECQACRDGIGSNDSESDLNINNYFGFADWDYLAKQETPAPPGSLDVSIPIGLEVSPLTESNTGNWLFNSGIWTINGGIYEDIVIVLKDGGNTKWFAYHLVDGNSSGEWRYPVGTNFLSHLSVYGREGNPSVPEPATMLLLGSGLLGLAVFGRRKFKK